MMKRSRKYFGKQITLVAIVAAGMAALPGRAQVQQLSFASQIAGFTTASGTMVCTPTPLLPAFAVGTNYGDGCPAAQAQFLTPYAVTEDSLGNVYIGDYGHYEVRVLYKGGTALAAAIQAANPSLQPFTITPGDVYTLAGGRTGAIPSTAPTGSTTKSIYCNGIVTGGVGSGPIALSSNGDNCPAAEAYIKPRTIALDKDGNVYFSSGAGSAAVRVVYVGGTAAASLITLLNGVAPTPGYIYSIITSKANGYAGDGLLATNAAVEMYSVRDIAIDSKGNIYAADGNAGGSTTNNNVRRVDAVTGIISTVAGSNPAGIANLCAEPSTAGCPFGVTGDGGPATQALLDSPYSIFFDSNDNLYIGDYSNGKLRAVYNAGNVGTLPNVSSPQAGYIYTVAGGGSTAVSTGATGLAASGLYAATSLAFTTVQTAGIDSANNLYLWDGTSKIIWKVSAQTGIATVFGGGGSTKTAGGYCSGTAGPKSADTIGNNCPAPLAVVQAGGHFTFDTYGDMFESESTNAIVREFSYNNQFANTAVGSNTQQPLAFLITAANTKLTAENFALQGGATTDYSDAGSDTCALNTTLALNTVCVFNVKFAPTLAGRRTGSVQLATTTPATSYLTGVGVAANLSVDPAAVTTVGTGYKPAGVAVDAAGNSYLSDTTTNTVYKFAAGATTGTSFITGLSKPAQIAIDGLGNLYVADAGNNRIAKTTSAGGTITALGTGLSNPQGVAVDGVGDLFIADTGNSRVVEITAAGGQIALTGLTGFTGLSGPTGLWEDSASNLYVADTGNNRVVELSPNATQTVLNLGTVTPTGVTLDAAGDVYITDTSSLQLLEYPAGSTSSVALATGLKAPNGLAMDTNGSLYVSDSGYVGEIQVNRAATNYTYPLTNLNTTTTTQVNAENTGNANLLFNGSTLTTATGNTAAFSIAGAASNGCALATAIAAGTECALTASFMPATPGLYTETASFGTNAPNNGSASLVLSGTAALLVNTTIGLAVTAPTTTTINYGQSVTVTATVTPQTTSTPLGGTYVFSVDGHAQALQTMPSTGIVTLTLPTPAVATHAVSFTYTSDGVYASGSKSISFTVAKAVTTTTLATTLGSSGNSPNITFTANVSSTTASGETGTVSFYSGPVTVSSVPIGTAQVNSSGVATYTTSTITYSSYSFTAVYNGNANFATSSSAALLEGGDFIVTPASTTLAVVQGAVATASLTLTPVFNYTGSITVTCSGLPASSVCRFVPTTVPMDGSTTQSLTVLIYTDVPSTLASFAPAPFGTPGPLQDLCALLGLLWAGCIGGLYLRQRTAAREVARRVRRLLTVLLFVGLLGAALGVTGCGTGVTNPPPYTPLGPQTITMTFTGTGNVVHTQAFSFTVSASQ
jgi:sugar lactone lactonase YvrE